MEHLPGMTTAVFEQRKRIRFLWLLSAAILFLLLFGRGAWVPGTIVGDVMRLAGLALILLCIAGRCWAALYIGGRKNTALATEGPYAMCRNPLYLFSTIGIAGIGLTFGSVALALLFFGLSYAVFSYVITQEEVALKRFFGAEYAAYRASVPRFFPSLNRLGVNSRGVEFNPAALKRTAIDASYFLLALPFAAIVGRLQEAGVLQPLFVLH